MAAETHSNCSVKSITYHAGGAATVKLEPPTPALILDPVAPADLRPFERAQDADPPLLVDVVHDGAVYQSATTHR